MPKYIFLDNWVYSLLTNEEVEHRLISFLKSRNYTVLITSLSLVELYNEQWETAGEKDRMYRTAQFLSRIPCVIVRPETVFRAEFDLYPNPLPVLPIELDLQDVSDEHRAQALLKFLRAEEIFLQQAKDIRKWRENYEQLKSGWLKDIEDIIANACGNGTLKCDENRRFVELQKQKELFLLSLDMRPAEPEEIDMLLANRLEHKRSGKPLHPTAIRLTSLCFWYAYVDIDTANRTPRRPSDIGDFYQLSLMPYCAAFTTDGSMYRLLKRIREPVSLKKCETMDKRELEERLLKHTSHTSR